MVNYGTTLSPGGLAGATAATRYVGGTASGAPSSGTFKTGDFVIDETGLIWVCTAAGTPGTWKAASAGGILTTAGDTPIMNGTPALARLAAGTAGQVLGVAGSPLLPAWGMGMTLLAATPVAGFALQNGTPTIITWTAPNDGALHRVLVLTTLHVTSTETGGQVNLTATLPDGTAVSSNIVNSGQATGVIARASSACFAEVNTAVSVVQQTALTAGAAVLWAEIWGS